MKKIKKVLVIGSGPIVIGQAAEFDYSGTQALLACREEGITTVVVNSNPATIQTDHEVADIVYIEPLTTQVLEKIIATEKPDGLIATVGGQTALNLTTQLHKHDILKKYKVKILGTDIKAITLGENRGKFRELMQKIQQPTLSSQAVSSTEEGIAFAKHIGFPVIYRSAYTLGGSGSGYSMTVRELKKSLEDSLKLSPAKQVLIEKSALGWGEFEYEIIRDAVGNKITICNMENIDPMGVHTGESIVVAPSQTLSDDDHQMLRNAAFQIVEALNIVGGCNIQFAFNYQTGDYFVIEVNPRLSRSSALASKATGYPIAQVATKIALGKTLPEITNNITGKSAFFEPALDYVVVKIPRWPNDKFAEMDTTIGVTMKSTGEAMGIGGDFEEAIYKAVQSLDLKENIFNFKSKSKETTNFLQKPNVNRLAYIFSALKGGSSVEEISKLTYINPWFISKLQLLIFNSRAIHDKINTYKMVDTCAGEFEAKTPYFYSTNGTDNEATPLQGKKVIILGSGPIRIGQGIEFDYMTVHAVKALKQQGIKSIVINNNPETVSTDYSISDRLYFEPLTIEFIKKIIENEKDGLVGVIVQFGGQTAINLAKQLEDMQVNILGTSASSIELAENRESTGNVIKKLSYKMPKWEIANSKKDIQKVIEKLTFPLLIRPSFVLGGEGMKIVHNKEEIKNYLETLPSVYFKKPLLIDEFLENALEVDIDLISDGENTVSFILEQLDLAGVHSGDSRCVYPPQKLGLKLQAKLHSLAAKVSKTFKIIGLGNIQCAIKNDDIYILEINPRASRTIPFLSKCLDVSLTQIATKIILGETLVATVFNKDPLYVSIKTPVFSFEKLTGVSRELGPLMKSTGEIMGIGKDVKEALEKTSGYSANNKVTNIYKL